MANYIKAMNRLYLEKCQSTPTKLVRCDVLFAVAELLVCFGGITEATVTVSNNSTIVLSA